MPRGDFVVVTHPEHQPAVDFITRSAHGPFIDTGVDVQLRSRPGMPITVERVYLSFNVIAQLAQLAGIVTENHTTTEREQQLIAQGKLEGMREGLGERLADVGDTLRRWLDSAGDSGSSDYCS